MCGRNVHGAGAATTGAPATAAAAAAAAPGALLQRGTAVDRSWRVSEGIVVFIVQLNDWRAYKV